MGHKFTINVRKIEDYKIEVDYAELAELYGISEEEVAARLVRAGRIVSGEDVLMHVLGLWGQRAETIERAVDGLTDRVTSIELNKPDRVKWIKTDRVIDSVVIEF